MSFEDFLQATAASAPPAGRSRALLALWMDARGDWVHAYLHRKEGDPANAAYWYRRAGQTVGTGELRAEWEAIARGLLAH